MWILQTQKQMLMNSIYSSQITEGYGFMQIHMNVINKLLSKYQNKQLIVNKYTSFTMCSYRELIFNQCPENVYRQLNQSQYYVDLYFVRQTFKYDILTQEQQDFILMNDFVSFYGKAAYYASQLEGLIQLAFIYNNDRTSVQYGIPSGYYNYTDSEYESCLGDNFIEPYDPRCRKWYQFAAQNPGSFFFEPYLDSLGKDLLMTLSTQINRENQLYSVNSIDIYMINLGKLFDSTQTNNSYSVLLHEFNSTVFAHPLLNNNNLTSWPDLEYYNLTSACKDQQKFQECIMQKQSFQYQINQTIDFIKTGNYSLEQNKNLDQLYQQWSRFGNQKISMIYPIQSLLKGHENQLPYSYSIVLTARVFSDNRESMKLFNLLDANYIKIPIFVSFMALIIAIIIFIANFARFQTLQIWKPIKLLTSFLQKSLLQDQSCRTLTTQFDRDNLRSQPSHFRKSSFKRQTKLTQTQLVSQPDYIYTYFQKLDQNDSLTQKSPRSIQLSKTASQKERQITESPLSQMKTYRLSQYSEQDEEIPIKDGYSESQQTIMTGKVSQFYIHKNKSMIQTAILNRQQQEQVIQNFQKEESETKKILKGLKPMFLEMKVIKKTFQDLEFVINYSVQSSQINTQDSLNALFHFAKAKELFLRLNNQTGLSRCYFNLGLIHLLKYEYSLSSEYFQSAIQINLNLIGQDYQTLENCKLSQDQDQDAKDQFIIFTKRVFSFAYSQKCSAFQQIYIEQKEYNNDPIENFIKNLHSYEIYANKKTKLDLQQQNILQLLKESLNQFQKVEKIIQNHTLDFSDVFKIFLYQEISEILIYLGYKQKELTNYLKKIELLFSRNDILIQQEQMSQRQIFKKKKTVQISNYNIKAIICETFKSKQLFLLGIVEQARQNSLQAIEYLTQSLEISTHYDHFQKMRTIQILAKLFKKYSLYQDFIDEEYLSVEINTPIDITILLELDPTFRQYNFLQIINGFKKYNFLSKNDRIQIIVYNRQINQFMPYTIIESNDHWKLVLDSLSELRSEFYMYEEITQNQIQLQQALNLSVAYIFEQKSLEASLKIKKKYILNINSKLQDFSSNQINQKNNLFNRQKRKKLLLLLSNGDIQSFKYLSQQKECKTQSLIIYHIKDQLNYEYKEYQNQHLKYELLSNQNDLIIKLSKLRLNENFDSQGVFLSVLNNF
ncbi:hypothetical protein ABPG74_003893 [Tetrahymena malaccensis]